MAHYNSNEGVFVPDSLVMGPWRARVVTVKAGAGVLTRGTVLGQITTGGKYVKSVTAAADGSQEPDAVLARDIDATSADVSVEVFVEGTFDRSKLVLGTGHTFATIDKPFRLRSIYLENPMG